MKDVIEKQSLFLHYIVKLCDPDLRHMLKNLTAPQIKAISGIIYNLYQKHFQSCTVRLGRTKAIQNILIPDRGQKRRQRNEKNALIARRWKQVLIILKAAIKLIPIKK